MTDGRPTRVVHVLPHRGGGAETYIDVLEEIDGFEHVRVALSTGRSAAVGAASIGVRYSLVARRVLAADLVHAHGDAATALALALLGLRPSVWTTHGLHLLRRAGGPVQAAMRAALRRAVATTARTICTSQAECDELAAIAGPGCAPRLSVVRNGIELPAIATAPQRAAARAAFGVKDGELAVLFLGELHERKRPLDAIAAAERAHRNGAPVVLLVAGDGPQADEVHARTAAAVRPLGHRRDVDRLLCASDVLVMPSEREGLSFAVLEAMGAGLALVVSDGPGNPEAIGAAGVVTPLGDVDALAAVLGALARDRGDVRRLGAAARARVAGTLTAARLRSGVAAAYREALGSSSA